MVLMFTLILFVEVLQTALFIAALEAIRCQVGVLHNIYRAQY